jgi:hypothetical protein
VLRASAGEGAALALGADALGAVAIPSDAFCAGERCATAVRRTSETATRRTFMNRSVEEIASGRSCTVNA